MLRHIKSGMQDSEWFQLSVEESRSDPIGLWEIVKTGRQGFGLEGQALERFVYDYVLAMLKGGSNPIVGDRSCASGWQPVFHYGTDAETTAAQSDALYCAGKIAQVIIYGDGNLMVQNTWRSDWTVLCNLKGTPSVDSVTCSHWSSLSSMAFKEGTQIGVYYSVPAGTTCANLPTYANAPVPVYLRLVSPK